jgi:ribosomal protein S18 acetylase RimI-like enzyme
MKFVIADKSCDADALARFFHRNLSSEYISHSELQGRRAIASNQWAQDIESVLRDEILARLKEPLSEMPAATNWQGVVKACADEELVGVALVTLVRDAPRPFGVIEDVIIDASQRGKGLGKEFLISILNMLKAAKLTRVFLESGKNNHSAHHLFAELGFQQVSVVMMRDL